MMNEERHASRALDTVDDDSFAGTGSAELEGLEAVVEDGAAIAAMELGIL